MREVILAGVALVLVAGTANAQPHLTGHWYTEGVEHGAHLQFIIENHADGTFTKIIRDATDCKTVHLSRESGEWQVQKDELLEMTDVVDGHRVSTRNGYFRDLFRIAMVDGNHIGLTDWKTHITWHMTKVGYDFEMPPPSGCTV